MPEDGDPRWMSQVPGGLFGDIPALGVHNPAALSEGVSGPEKADDIAQRAAVTALHQEVVIENAPTLPENLPLHRRGFHPAELRGMLMNTGVAAQNAEQLSDDPRRGDVTTGVYDLFTVLSAHEAEHGADAFTSVQGLIEASGLPEQQAQAIARTHDIANREDPLTNA